MLDNGSTMDQFVNPKNLKNIHTLENPVCVFCNAGITSTNKKSLFGLVDMWKKTSGNGKFIIPKT